MAEEVIKPTFTDEQIEALLAEEGKPTVEDLQEKLRVSNEKNAETAKQNVELQTKLARNTEAFGVVLDGFLEDLSSIGVETNGLYKTGTLGRDDYGSVRTKIANLHQKITGVKSIGANDLHAHLQEPPTNGDNPHAALNNPEGTGVKPPTEIAKANVQAISPQAVAKTNTIQAIKEPENLIETEQTVSR